MASYLRKQGSIPTQNPQEYGHLLEETLVQVKEFFTGNIILTTLSCLGEDLSSELNLKRKEINETIKRVGNKYSCCIADVSKGFDDELTGKNTRDDLEETFLNPELINADAAGFVNKTESPLFYLTIDGCHINQKGADIYFREIKKCLEKLN